MKSDKYSVRIWRIKVTLICLVSLFVAPSLNDSVSAMASETGPAPLNIPESFSGLFKKASKSVVNISTVKVVKGSRETPFSFRGPFGNNDPFRDFFDRFLRDQMPKDFKQRSLGSGLIIDKDGFILTNNHVVEKADEINVRLSDNREFIATIVGRDSKTDLALIRIKADTPLEPLPFGDSDELEVGDWVVAIGNPFGLGNSITAGIVSAKYRQIGAGAYDNFIQTDAPINPGNSGGPLLNTAGEVIGINTAIFSQSGGSVGIGFAIPVNMAKDLLPQLKEGKVVRGWLGVMIQKITPELMEKLGLKDDRGALVADVSEEGPADKAGIERGDVIVSFGGKEIREMHDLPYAVASTPVGKKVNVEIIRNGKKKSLKAKVGELEEKSEAAFTRQEDPDLGMKVEEINPQLARTFRLPLAAGLVIVQVEKDTPAAEAGLRAGDIILEVDQVPIKTLETYYEKIREFKEGDTILLLIKRGRSAHYATLRMQE
ncbi:MAG: DegQ family serine endoprotease [Desulfatiglans sp.]|nr:DegQ family serine endoprotease [Desulfatiglans sp.]